LIFSWRGEVSSAWWHFRKAILNRSWQL
jgi:hypothetical protein